jgi:hypothetical protein
MDSIMQVIQSIIAALGSGAGSVGSAVGAVTGKMDMAGLMALAAALGWASGFRLYAVVFITGMAGLAGWIPLPEGLKLLQHPAILTASGFMLFIEFFADKIPGVDSLWDMVHSVIRVPAGAALAAGVFGADSATMATVAGLLGGALAATSQATKTTTRAAINTSPEPFSNIAMSLLEDGLVVAAMWLATNHPVIFGITLLIVVILMVLLVMMLIKFLKAVIRRMSAFFSSTAEVA